MPRRPKPKPYALRLSPVGLWSLGAVGLLLVLGTGGVLTAAHMEEDDTFCASCHSEPESTFVARRADAPATDLASFHYSEKTRCIDCHSGPGVSGRAWAIQIGVGDLLAFWTGQARQPAQLTHGLPEANCLKCHAETPTQSGGVLDSHFHRFLARWQARDPQAATCVSCHTAHATDGQVDILYLNQDHTVAVCDRCHQALGDGD